MVKINSELITDDMMYEGGTTAYDYVTELDSSRVNDNLQRIKEDKLWGEIRRAAQTNKTLQAALDHAIMIDKFRKEYKDGI